MPVREIPLQRLQALDFCGAVSCITGCAKADKDEYPPAFVDRGVPWAGEKPLNSAKMLGYLVGRYFETSLSFGFAASLTSFELCLPVVPVDSTSFFVKT